MSKKIEISKEKELEIIKDYTTLNVGTRTIAEKHKVPRKRIIDILRNNNIEMHSISVVDKSSELYQKYPVIPNKHYIAICKLDGKKFNDYENRGGYLTSYLKETYHIDIPSYSKRMSYYKHNKKQWYEQYFDIILEEDKPTNECPYCSWKSEFIDEKGWIASLSKHLKFRHNKTIADAQREFPEFLPEYQYASKTKARQIETDETKYVECKICGKKLARIDSRHLSKHNITLSDYREKYDLNTLSDVYRDKCQKRGVQLFLSMNGRTDKFTSSYEHKILDYYHSKNVECDKNRILLKGKEIDIYFPQQKIGVEFNGLQWHTEKFGKKDKYYHLNKSKEAEEAGIQLIHIFEDEFYYNEELVFSKLNQILHLNEGVKVGARKCIISQINPIQGDKFLDKYHIQGKSTSSIYLGAFYNDNLIAVMSFKRDRLDNNKWELTRFASDYHYICQGVGGKLFKTFIRLYNPIEIKSFADRRWTTNKEDNLYIKLGFILEKELQPDYKYYNSNIEKYKRIHKFNMRKQILHKKYGLPLSMTEREMTEYLGYDRIWDCGLFKYVWKNKNN